VTYEVRAIKFEGLRAFNKPPASKRGHGTPQPRYALEVHLTRSPKSCIWIRRNAQRASGQTEFGHGNYLRIGSMVWACIIRSSRSD